MGRELIETNPEGHKLAPVAPLTVEQEENAEYNAAGLILAEDFSGDAPAEPNAAPVVEEATASDGASGPGPNPQARLEAARAVEASLIASRPSLIAAQRMARGAVADAVQELQRLDPHRQTPAELSAEYRASCQAERKARVEREGGGQPRIAYVDRARKYQSGGNADDYARKLARTSNRRGAYAMAGGINHDPSRGPVPKPVEKPRPTIPALAGNAK